MSMSQDSNGFGWYYVYINNKIQRHLETQEYRVPNRVIKTPRVIVSMVPQRNFKLKTLLCIEFLGFRDFLEMKLFLQI